MRRWLGPALALALLAWPAVAQEPAEPTITETAEGGFHARVEVAATPDQVLSLIADPATVARLDNAGAVVEDYVRQGACATYLNRFPTPLGELAVRARSCREGNAIAIEGESDDFHEYRIRWRVESMGDGTRLHYELLTVPAMRVPRWMVRSQTRARAGRLLERIRDELES